MSRIKIRSIAREYRLPILSGFLIGTSYIPFPPWALLFCLTPLWIFYIDQESLKKIFWGGWITQFILNLIGFHWVAYTASEFGHFPWPLSLLTLLAYASIAHLYFPLSGVLWKWLIKRLVLPKWGALVLLPVLFSVIQNILPIIFPWHFGYPWLWAGLPGAQTAEFIGFEGLNIAVLFINIFLLLAWRERQNKKPLKRWLSCGLGLFIGLNVWGYIIGWQWQQKQLNSNEFQALVVQGNIGNLEKAHAEHGRRYLSKIIDTYLDLTRQALNSLPEDAPPVNAVFWPETAFPDFLNGAYQYSMYATRLKATFRELEVPLVTGSYGKNPETGQIFNSVFIVNAQGQVQEDHYKKTHLLAFGEYLPFGDAWPQLKKWAPFVSDFARGDGPKNLLLGQLRLGVQICYEGLFPDFSAHFGKTNTDFIVNVTNDSWFGYPFEPYQHLYMTAARAIETRRPLLRITNTGISTLVHPNGRVDQAGPRNKTWFGFYTLRWPKENPPTVYSRIVGIWPLTTTLAAIFLAVLGIFYKSKTKIKEGG